MDRSDFEVLQRAVLPTFAPLLRKHPGDPKCKTTELCFLLRAGWVVVRPLRGRARGWLTWRCWTENATTSTTVELHRPLSRSRCETATTTILAVMLVWVNEKAIFRSGFSHAVYDGLL